MKRITYAGGSFLTSDEVANALLSFVATAPKHRRPQVVTVPAYSADGESSVLGLVLGPGMQLMSQVAEASFPEPDTSTFAADLLARARIHGDTARSSSSHSGTTTFDYDTF